ncbi:MAG TPA: hypothetical protein ENG50_04695 [Candidatus Altiarchaeales archaeon]|nr:MAG: hypothetical protein DRO65_02165 [Candidatus Altiarchaeales archaeon]HDN83643.1 hypothetical protein [Candidatus Altiarchaeales archaeon]
MTDILKVVLDVLKPHNPDIVTLAKELASLPGVEGVNISVYEIDKEVENVKITIKGKFSDMDKIKEKVAKFGGTIHSIDEVVAGKKDVKEEETLHERHHEI